MIGWILAILVAAAAAYFVGVLNRPDPVVPANVFGLDEARAARGFIQTAEQAKAVKAVVVGVLGYEDAVAEDVEDEAEMLLQSRGSNERRVAGYQDDIVALRAKIADLEGANTSIDASRDDLASLAKLFA